MALQRLRGRKEHEQIVCAASRRSLHGGAACHHDTRARAGRARFGETGLQPLRPTYLPAEYACIGTSMTCGPDKTRPLSLRTAGHVRIQHGVVPAYVSPCMKMTCAEAQSYIVL